MTDFAIRTVTSIKFAGTQVPSSDVNTLDDYEEGTFTPGLAFGGGTTGITYGTQSGRYIKIGKKVTANLRIVLTNKGSSTGAVTITGMPFTIVNSTGGVPVGSLQMETVTFADYPFVVGTINATTLTINESTNAGVVTSLADTDFSNTSLVNVTITYEATA